MLIRICVVIAAIAACEKREPPAPVTEARTVPSCGVSVVPPAGFHEDEAQLKLEHLVMKSATARFSVACLQKSEGPPRTLAQQRDWLVGRLDHSAIATVVNASSLGHALGRPVLLVELNAGDGGGGALMLAESATAFYWVLYTAAKDDRAQRDRLFASLRVTDPDADKGPTRWWHPTLSLDPNTLAEARAAFQTTAHNGRPTKGFDGKPAPAPPPKVFTRVEVKGPQGKLAAYITPDPRDGKKHPAVIWAHGGFGVIDSAFWEPAPRSNDQSARAFRDADIILAVGSWRAENDNPGDYQLFYGEVDDYLALRDHVAKLPYVDPDRIYLAGHSSGGTLVLLAAELSSQFRAAFSIGGSPVMFSNDTYANYGGVPFNVANERERQVRSAAPFVRSIQRPVFYFEGAGMAAPGSAQWMEDQAAKLNVPFHAYIAFGADHFTILAPLTELIAQKILADTGPTTNITFTQQEIDGLKLEKPAD